MNPAPSQYESSYERPRVAQSQTLRPRQDLTEYLREYAKEKPEVVALWCFGIGFVLGWKLKPW
jgi:hypothetical protein